MRVKDDSVRVFGLRPEMIFAYQVAYEVYREYGNEKNCVLTSARDGTHKRGSDHYVGNAIDIRVWGFDELGVDLDDVAEKIRSRLSVEFEVFNEGDHIHIGFDVQYL